MAEAHVLSIYPTALKVEDVLKDAARDGRCVLAHRVTTFPQLIDALYREVGSPAAVLTDLGARLAVEDVLAARYAPGGSTFAPLRRRRGFSREVLSVIAELKSAFLGPADLRATLEATATLGATDRERLEEITAIYEDYQGLLARAEAIDRHDREWHVIEHLRACLDTERTPRPLQGIRRVAFVEIYDYSLTQYLIAVLLIRLVGDATLTTFAHPENVDATRFLDRTWNRFVASEAIADHVLPDFVVRGGRHGNLATVLRYVFSDETPPPTPPDGRVQVVLAPGRYREVEEAGRAVRRLLEAGTPPERIALLVRDLAVYGDLIEDVCRRYGIAVFFRKGKPLTASPLIKCLVRLLDLPRRAYSREALIEVCESDFLRTGLARAGPLFRAAGYLDARTRPLLDCLEGRRRQLEEELAGERSPERRARRARDLKRFARVIPAATALLDRLHRLDRARPIADHVRALRKLVAELSLRPASRAAGLEAARRDARAWNLWEEVLDDLAATEALLLGGGAVPFDHFVQRVRAAVDHLLVEDIGQRAGSVRALSILDARGLDFDHVFILGLNEGSFPRLADEGPLFPDSAKLATSPAVAARLATRLGDLGSPGALARVLRTTAEENREDPFLFFLALSMAEESLTLLVPAIDERGNPTIRSAFVDATLRSLGHPTWAAGEEDGRLVRRVSLEEFIPSYPNCVETAEWLARSCLEGGGRPAPPLDTALGAIVGPERLESIASRAAIERRRESYAALPSGDPEKAALADEFVGRLTDVAGLVATVLRDPARVWSATQFEELAQCGFRFFAARLLGLRPEEAPAHELSRLEVGELAHRLLERFFREEGVPPPDAAQAHERARSFLARVEPQFRRRLEARDPHFFAVAWEQVGEMLESVVDCELLERSIEPGYRAALFEHEVTFTVLDHRHAPEGGPLTLRVVGRCDRADFREDGDRITGIRVRDYKTTKDAQRYAPLADPARELGRRGFQIPVYLMGLREELGRLAAEATLSGGYHLLRAPEHRALYPIDRRLTVLEPAERRVAAADLAAVGQRPVADTLIELAATAAAGRFDVDPARCDAHCPFRRLCRSARTADAPSRS